MYKITVAVKTMGEAHKNNYTAATQYITARMAQINSASINAPGVNPCRISKVDINCGESLQTRNGITNLASMVARLLMPNGTLIGIWVAVGEAAEPCTGVAAEVVVAGSGMDGTIVVAKARMPIIITITPRMGTAPLTKRHPITSQLYRHKIFRPYPRLSAQLLCKPRQVLVMTAVVEMEADLGVTAPRLYTYTSN
jgi:hypothetical protein